jgi:hypothetical protein
LTAYKQEVPTSGAVGGDAAKEAALIATFYGPRGDQRINRLHDKLSQSLRKLPKPFLDCFKPPGDAAHDAIAVQLALNCDGNAVNAWATMRQRLEGIFVEDGSLEGTWGHSLIYQAELSEGVDPEDAVLGGLLPAIRRLHSSEDLHPLASADVSGGRLWLVGIPDRADGLDAATVYLGLSSADNAEALLDMVYGPEAMLLESDLIAHKGYFLMRQYRSSDLESRYQVSLNSLQETTNKVLRSLARHPPVPPELLHELARKYVLVFRVLPHLSDLRIALVKQKHNYRLSFRMLTEGREVIAFHREHLETATLELKLKLEELRYVLKPADKAVSMAQVREHENQEARQVRTEAWLAAVALSLALAKIINHEATWALLSLFASAFLSIDLTDDMRHTRWAIMVIVFTQILIVGSVAVVGGLLVNKFVGRARGLTLPPET